MRVRLQEIKNLKIGTEAEIKSGLHTEQRLASNGKPYIAVMFDDGFEGITVNVWEKDTRFEEFRNIEGLQLCDAVIKYKGLNKGYENYEIVSYKLLERPSIVDCVEVDALKEELKSFIMHEVPDEDVKKVLFELCADKDLLNSLFITPVNDKNGYSFKGGALAHMIRTGQLIVAVAGVYDAWKYNKGGFKTVFDRSVMIATSIFQYIGNTNMFKFSKTGEIEKTYEGELNGSAYYGDKILTEILDKSTMSGAKKEAFIHAVTSSRGSLQFGAVTTARTKEAIAFNKISELDILMGNFEYLERISLGNNFGKLAEKHYCLDNFSDL